MDGSSERIAVAYCDMIAIVIREIPFDVGSIPADPIASFSLHQGCTSERQKRKIRLSKRNYNT